MPNERNECKMNAKDMNREAFEKEERALRNAVNGKTVKSSADEFTGKITKAESVQEEVLQAEPKTPESKKDMDIFVSRDSKAFREMGVFEVKADVHEVPVVHMEPEMERAPRNIYEQKLPPETEFTGRLAESFHVPEERSKKVVTASGKVIETDTETIVKNKLEVQGISANLRSSWHQIALFFDRSG